MFTDEMMEKFFTHKFISSLSIGLQSDVVNAFKEILEDILEGNPYECISALFVSATADESVSE